MSTLNYSKWDKIELSDDEDDTHPNIDTPSLFKWRHEARVQRMEEQKQKEEKLLKDKQAAEKELVKKKALLDQAKGKEESSSGALKVDDLAKELKVLEKKKKELEKTEAEMEKEKKKQPWNVDTISKPGFDHSSINKSKSKWEQEKDLTEEEKSERMAQFIKENREKIRKFGLLRKWEDSKKFLQENLHLVCEDTANDLVVWCVNLEIEEKHELMEHVAHQVISLQFMLELSKQLDVDPRSTVNTFFYRMEKAKQADDQQYVKGFNEELSAFKDRIRKRAKEKVDKAVAEYEEEEREKRLGPGGLDPVDVFESLPEELQKCFESQDIELLKETMAKLPDEEARYHLDRCIKSGLWVPDANKKAADSAEDAEAESKEEEGEEEEETYEEVS